jgi:hypothetical protein
MTATNIIESKSNNTLRLIKKKSSLTKNTALKQDKKDKNRQRLMEEQANTIKNE